MFDSREEVLEGGRVRKTALLAGGEPLSFREVFQRWREDEDFRSFFVSVLAEAPFEAFYWEAPPVSRGTIERGFEFVLVESRSLAGIDPDPETFASHFQAAGALEDVAVFANLGRDALLVAPRPGEPASAYASLATFSRRAAEARQHSLWETVGAVLEPRLDDRPVWLSTAGDGVAWLHVRLDSRPKYYNHRPYREWKRTS